MIERIKKRSRLIRPLLIPLVFYIGLLAFSTNWLAGHSESPWKILVALLPVVPGIFLALGIIRAILQLDELERRILLEGLAVSFVGTFLLVTSMGLLGMADVPQLNGVYISLFMAVLWLVGKQWANRRYE